MKFGKKLVSLVLAGGMVLASMTFVARADEPIESQPYVGPNIFTTAVEGQPRQAGRPSGISRQEIIDNIPNYTPSGTLVTVAAATPTANIWTAGWGNPTPNAQVRDLIGTPGTMAINMYLEAFPNPMVTRDVEVSDDEYGNRTYTFTIYTENLWSDGTFIDASHFVSSALFLTHQYYRDLANTAGGFLQHLGRTEWQNGEVDELASMRLLADDMFSITIAAEWLPNVHEAMILMSIGPFPHHVVLPGHEVRTNENGSYFYPPLDFEFVTAQINGGSWEEEILDDEGNVTGTVTHFTGDGWRFNPTVTGGAYTFDGFDPTDQTLRVRANPYFQGTWDGFLPRIESIVWTQVPSAVQVDALALGTIDVLVAATSAHSVINPAFDLLVFSENPTHSFVEYTRNGYSMIRFHVDHGPTQFTHVRQAIIQLLDRDEITHIIQAGHGVTVQGPYSPAQWMFHDAIERGLYDQIIHWSYNPDAAIALLEANGWVLNQFGEDFRPGVDAIRYKDVTGMELQNDIRHPGGDERPDRTIFQVGDRDLMRLEVHWMTHTAEMGVDVTTLLEVMLPMQLEQAGFSVVEHRSSVAVEHASRSASGAPYAAYHMFNMGLGFATAHSPWLSVSTDPNFWGGGFNATFINDEDLYQMARQMQFGEILTEEGRYDFVTAWMDFILEMNYLVLDVALFANQFYDFVNLRIGNWHNNSLWGFTGAVLRAYFIDLDE